MSGFQGGSGDIEDDGYVDVQLKDPNGNDLATSGNPLRVDPTGATAQPITDNGGSITVDGTVSAIQSGSWSVSVNNAAGASAVNIQDGGNVISIDDAGSSITIDTTQLPSSLVGGRLDINNGAWLGSTAPTVGQKTMANSIPVVVASDQNLLATSANQTTQITALQLIDDIVHSTNAALNKAAVIAGQLDDTSTTAATENNVAPVRITAQRGLHINLRDVSGTELGTVSNPVEVRSKFQTTYLSGSVSVGTSAVEAKVGGSRLSTRKMLYIENTGNTDIYYGPATVTTANGAILRRRQFVFLSAGDITVQVISSAVGGSVIVQEMS